MSTVREEIVGGHSPDFLGRIRNGFSGSDRVPQPSGLLDQPGGFGTHAVEHSPSVNPLGSLGFTGQYGSPPPVGQGDGIGSVPSASAISWKRVRPWAMAVST